MAELQQGGGQTLGLGLIRLEQHDEIIMRGRLVAQLRAGEQAFFGGGGVGAWMRDLPEEEARAIVARHRAQMSRFGYIPEGW